VAPIGLHIMPEGRHLVQYALTIQHPDRPELDPHGDRPSKEPLHLLRTRRGRDIPIQGLDPQERIPHGPPDAPRLEPRSLQGAADLADGDRWFET